MKVVRNESGTVVEIELTRRNLAALLMKLDDPLSARTLSKTAEEGPSVFVMVKAVEDAEHYSDRAPGEVYMPSSGITWDPEDANTPTAKMIRQVYGPAIRRVIGEEE